jgi:hypothetical protein
MLSRNNPLPAGEEEKFISSNNDERDIFLNEDKESQRNDKKRNVLRWYVKLKNDYGLEMEQGL